MEVPLVSVDVMDNYREYHYHWWCRRRHYLRLKREKLVTNLLSLFLVTSGAIVGPLLTNALIVAVLSVGATLIKGYHESRRYDSLIDLSRFAYTTYAKFLSEWKEMRGEEEKIKVLGDNLLTTHHIILDLAPALPDDLKRQYAQLLPNMSEWIDGGESYKNTEPSGPSPHSLKTT